MMMTNMNMTNDKTTTMVSIYDEELQELLDLSTNAPQGTSDFSALCADMADDSSLDALLGSESMGDASKAFFGPLADMQLGNSGWDATESTDDDDSGFATDCSSTSDVESMSPKSAMKSLDNGVATDQLSAMLLNDEGVESKVFGNNTSVHVPERTHEDSGSGDETDTISEHSSDCEFSQPKLVQGQPPASFGNSLTSNNMICLNLQSPSQQMTRKTYAVSNINISKPHPKVEMDPRSMVQLRNLDPRLQIIAAPRMDTGFKTRVEKGRASIHNPLNCDICRSNKPESRKRALHRYREKRARRNWKKNPRYCARSSVACGRKRVKGRFVRGPTSP